MGINKIDDGWYREQAAIAERQNREHIAKFDRSFLGVMAKFADDNRERDDGGGGVSWCPCLNSKMATFTPVGMLATLATFEKSQ